VKRYIKYLKGSGAFVFKAGFGELIDTLRQVLEHNNVKIIADSEVNILKEGKGSYDIHYTQNGKALF
jgi:phytoene dehydrogenase-like protein